MKDAPVESIVLAVVCAGVSLAAWQWQRALHARQPSAVVTERWEHVRELFPPPEPLRIPSETTAETWQGLLRANPFSRARRHVSPPAAEAPTGTPEKPLPPQFVFKGRVSMGTKQRGILEDRRQKKTHFVQVGQDVLGFRVVEIAEDRIVLSDVKTNERVDIPLASKAAAETEKSSEGSQKP
ncbi:MAG TPA: hypothetical protein DDX89_05065 [Candidatus Omnitrophica bacterium]|nr:MAG: hypothetical protein A2105_05370 [Omnitrophica WOR_2 bacterium GWF2_63_9]OGX31496.1 MAG: hypothetical protein A3E56_01120 [Omnitrophica WOR_2 bacterium RIFCSPHIGHO2_12_FULL_64_13]OGX35704.1 MAG: hypothetical protein A3B73_05015 [Omnitrophica WOR_2 bacterium RIFCSPHIGHO2_02_FULL_63_39]OGX45168.1 MAG: hypothetical protein A3I71_04440 [Omnitrophica WOR_2 bacterium RIFCSPLOWO2_02_FULL_63_16]OGX49480.1 MAG: hypothetical protein A3G88_05740 [Omnitrophica WOR_2 bacterium RIFCSPLOWO2_12_FULL_63